MFPRWGRSHTQMPQNKSLSTLMQQSEVLWIVRKKKNQPAWYRASKKARNQPSVCSSNRYWRKSEAASIGPLLFFSAWMHCTSSANRSRDKWAACRSSSHWKTKQTRSHVRLGVLTSHRTRRTLRRSRLHSSIHTHTHPSLINPHSLPSSTPSSMHTPIPHSIYAHTHPPLLHLCTLPSFLYSSSPQ